MHLLALPRRALRPRLGTLMMLVAVLAVGMGAKIRWDRCTEWARFDEQKAGLYSDHAGMWNSWITGDGGPAPLWAKGYALGTSRDRFHDLAGRCGRLRGEFRRDAWNPLAPMPAEIDTKEFAPPGWNW